MPTETVDLRRAPYNRLKGLKDELVPWAPFADWRDELALIPNQDEVLTLLARLDEREWQRMERQNGIIRHGIMRRCRTLLSGGWTLEPGNNSPAARLQFDFAETLLKRLRSHMATIITSIHYGVFWGWRPLERVWDFESTWRGKPAWFLKSIREKQPHEFRFTANRDLVWLGNGASGGPYQYFRMDEEQDRLRWIIFTSGSTDNPYGVADLRYVWLLKYMYAEFQKTWAQGVNRSMGTIKVTQNAAGEAGKLRSLGEEAAASSSAGSAKTVTEVAAEFAQVLRLYQESGVLVEKLGWKIDVSGEVAYAEGWKHPLEYIDGLIALILTGDKLSVSAGDVGSRAAAETKKDDVELFCMADGQEIAGCFNDQIIGDALRLQFPDPDPDDAPEWALGVGRKIDLAAAQALYGWGAKLDGRKLAREFGVPLITDPQPDDVVLEKQQLVMDAEGNMVPVGPVGASAAKDKPTGPPDPKASDKPNPNDATPPAK